MDSILTRTRETALLSSAFQVRSGWLAPSSLNAGGDRSVLVAEIAYQDAAVAPQMAVAIPVVTDHTFSTRSGSPSCSPPV